MTKNIIVIGCSFSRAFNDKNLNIRMSWPEYLSEKTGWTVNNYAQYCNSITHQWHTLRHLLENIEQKIDAVIVQLTGFDRITFVKDWRFYTDKLYLRYKGDNNVKNYFEFKDSQVILNYRDWNKLGVMHFNPGANIKDKNWRQLYNYLIKHSIDSVGLLSKEYALLVQTEIIRMLKVHSIPFIIYSHYYSPKNIKKLYNNNLFNRYKNNLDFILQYDMENFDKYVIDDGHHFSIVGNKVIVDNFILPKLTSKLAV